MYFPLSSSLSENAIEWRTKSIVSHFSFTFLKVFLIDSFFNTSHSIKKLLLIDSAKGFTLLKRESPWYVKHNYAPSSDNF